MKTPLCTVVGLLGFQAASWAQGFSSSALGPPMKDVRHAASDYAPGDKRPSRLTVLELPLHGKGNDDYKKLQGAFEYVRDELLVWSYPFAYWGVAGNGSRVALQPGQTLTYVGMAGNNYRFSTPGTGTFVVVPPPNIAMAQVLNFAIVPLTACNKTMVVNRLGSPTEESTDPDTGQTKFTYKRTVREELETRNVYSFKVWFDATDRVARVKDDLEQD